MKKILFAALPLLWNSIIAHDTYAPFAVSTEDLHMVLKDTFTVPVSCKQKLPADIMYACADIKYKDGVLKFCECGDGIYMSFRTAQVRLNNHIQDAVSPYWGIFWHYLKQFNLPMWLVDDRGPQNAMALDVFEHLGGRYCKNFSKLKADPLFKELITGDVAHRSAIKDYKGIIVYRASHEKDRDGRLTKWVQDKYPKFLFVNMLSRDYVKRKDNTYQLFVNANLQKYIPQFKLYPTIYDPMLAQQIQTDFNTFDPLVIKPTYSSLAQGVNIIAQKDLDDFLKLILRDNATISLQAHRCFSYWRTRRLPTFLVSECAESKTIYKDGKPYDPTMRVVFILHHDQGIIHCNVIAGFWKIPVKSLADNVSLTDKHVTIAHAGAYYSGILADSADWQEIKGILQHVLPQMYQTILEKNASIS